MTERAKLNLELQRYEKLWRKGEISFSEYSSTTKQLIKEHYNSQEHKNKTNHSEEEPKGLLGVLVKLVRRLS